MTAILLTLTALLCALTLARALIREWIWQTSEDVEMEGF